MTITEIIVHLTDFINIYFLYIFFIFGFRGVIHNSDIVHGWSVPFPGSDRSVVLRSQRFFFEQEKKRPIQLQAYLKLGSLFYVAVLAFLGALFALLARFQCGRYLLLKVSF